MVRFFLLLRPPLSSFADNSEATIYAIESCNTMERGVRYGMPTFRSRLTHTQTQAHFPCPLSHPQPRQKVKEKKRKTTTQTCRCASTVTALAYSTTPFSSLGPAGLALLLPIFCIPGPGAFQLLSAQATTTAAATTVALRGKTKKRKSLLIHA